MAGIGAIIGPRVVDSGRRQRAFSHCGVAKPRFSRDQPIVVPVVSKEPKPCQPAGKGLARRSASGRHRRSPEHLRRKAQKGMPEPGGGRRRQAPARARLVAHLRASHSQGRRAHEETSPALGVALGLQASRAGDLRRAGNDRAPKNQAISSKGTQEPKARTRWLDQRGARPDPAWPKAPPVQQVSASPCLQGAQASHGQAKANAHNAPTNSVPGEQAILEAEAEVPSVLRRPGDALEGWPAKEAAEAEESMQEPHLHRAPEAKDALPGLSAEGLAKEAEEHAHRAAKDASPGAGAAEAEARARREQADALPGEGRPARTAAEAEAPRVRTAPPAKDVATGGPTRTAAEAEAQRVRRPSSATDAATGGPTRVAAEAEALSVRRAPSAKDAATGRPTRTAAEAEAPRVRRAPSATDAATGGPARVAAEAEEPRARRALDAKDSMPGRAGHHGIEEAPLARMPRAADALPGGQASPADDVEAQLTPRSRTSSKDQGAQPGCEEAKANEASGMRAWPAATNAMPGPEAPQATLRRASAEGVDRRIQVPTVQGMERGPDAAKQEPLAKKAEVSQRGPSLRSTSTSSRQGSTRKANQGSLAERTPRTDRFAHWADATWKLAHTGYGQPWAGLLPSVPKQGLEAIDLENMQVFCDPALLQGMQVPELSSRAMGTAFCDRSVRLRDGCAVRALLQPDPLEETAQVGCENERMMPPAGLRSFEFAENKQQEPASRGVAMVHAFVPSVLSAGDAAADEMQFRRAMTRKVRARSEGTRPKQARKPTEVRNARTLLQESEAVTPRRAKKAVVRSEEAVIIPASHRFEELACGNSRPLRAASAQPGRRNPITWDDGLQEQSTPRQKAALARRTWDGQDVSILLNHEQVAAEEGEHRLQRLQADAAFAELCTPRAGHERARSSLSMANALQWDS